MIRTTMITAALLLSAPAFACPMADAAAFAEAAEAVKKADGTHVSLMVEGMHCGSCSEKITAALNGIDGVKASAADYQTGRTEVAIDVKKVKVDALIAKISELGFKAKLES